MVEYEEEQKRVRHRNPLGVFFFFLYNIIFDARRLFYLRRLKTIS